MMRRLWIVVACFSFTSGTAYDCFGTACDDLTRFIRDQNKLSKQRTAVDKRHEEYCVYYAGLESERLNHHQLER